ncbi:hypothetical protein B7494_g2180 [Chlorociboria aeruginascens]|nr:hypothetical protein B7494_g2180 [Chlorociboria aeruginascens]
MSKIFFTLAFYHDGGTLKPQLVVSINPMTQITMKGSDWKGTKIGNTNSNPKFGARHRFEYSVTGGKAVTRCSLVMNTSAILPPFMWLSNHPTGPPTRRGHRGVPGRQETEEAKREAAKERAKVEARKELKKINAKYGKSSRRSSKRREELEEIVYGDFLREENKRIEAKKERSRSRSSRRQEELGDDVYRDSRSSKLLEESISKIGDTQPKIPDRDKRREERHKRLRSVSSASRSEISGVEEPMGRAIMEGLLGGDFGSGYGGDGGDAGDGGGGDGGGGDGGGGE